MNVKELLEKHGLNPTELWKQTGIPRARISKWVHGKGSPKAGDDKILTAFFANLKREEVPTESSVMDSGDDNHYMLKNKTPDKIIEDLAASSRDHAAADLKRAEAEVLREQNHKRIIDHITGNATEEIPEAIESRFSDLLELIARLGTGTRWKNEKDAREELSRLWHGEKKVSSKAGIRDGSGK